MTSTFVPDAAREDFPSLAGVAFLNSASMGAVSRPALSAVEHQLALLTRGPGGDSWGRYIEEFERGVADARRAAAVLLGANEDEIGLVTDTTAGLHQAIDAIPFRAGDNVVLSDLEYPQVALAADNAVREHGVEMRFVRHRGGLLRVDDYCAAIDARTRAVLVSSVSWVTGQRMDLAAFSELARERGFYLVVDAVQQLGAVALDCSALRIDFLASGAYKWLCAPFGCGLFYVRRGVHESGLRVRRLGLLGLEPPPGGWDPFYDRADMEPLPALSPERSARRFEAQGTPNRLGAPGLAAALAYRAARGVGAERHLLDLAGELMAELATRGAAILTPRRDAERAGIVTFGFGGGPVQDRALRDHLAASKIYVSARYCSGAGGVRAAVHLYNERADIAALLAAVDEFRRS